MPWVSRSERMPYGSVVLSEGSRIQGFEGSSERERNPLNPWLLEPLNPLPNEVRHIL